MKKRSLQKFTPTAIFRMGWLGPELSLQGAYHKSAANDDTVLNMAQVCSLMRLGRWNTDSFRNLPPNAIYREGSLDPVAFRVYLSKLHCKQEHCLRFLHRLFQVQFFHLLHVLAMAMAHILLTLAYEETALISVMPIWAVLIIFIDVDEK